MSEPKEIIGIRIVQGEVCKVARPAQEPPKVRPREEPPVTVPPWLTFESPRVIDERLRQSAIVARKALAQEIAAALREQAPQDAPALVEESPSKPRAHTQDRAESLTVVLDEIEARALELNHPFDRAEWPGTKDEFRAFLRWKDSGLAYRLPTDDGRLSDELRPHGVKFGRPGRDKTKGLNFYRALFPDFPA